MTNKSEMRTRERHIVEIGHVSLQENVSGNKKGISKERKNDL